MKERNGDASPVSNNLLKMSMCLSAYGPTTNNIPFDNYSLGP